jgi:hypothetical protein
LYACQETDRKITGAAWWDRRLAAGVQVAPAAGTTGADPWPALSHRQAGHRHHTWR